MARTVTPEKIVSDNGKTQVVEKSFARGKGQEPPRETRTFERPTLGYFAEYVMSLSDQPTADSKESPLAHAHRLYITGLDREIASDVYERAAGMSTIVRIAGKEFDLYELPLAKFLAGYNKTVDRRNDLFDMAGVSDADRDDVENDMVAGVNRSVSWTPWSNAAKKHVEAGKIVLQSDGKAAAA